MSMHLEFEPHSWYYGFAIKKDDNYNDPCATVTENDEQFCTVHGKRLYWFQDYCEGHAPKWSAFTDDGNTYSIVELHGTTLRELQHNIRSYWLRKGMPAYYAAKLLKSPEAKELL
jgi:hypothetical protein